MAQMFSADFSNVDLTAKQFVKFQVIAAQGMDGILNEYSHRYRDEVVKNASGRPGPEIVTGEYVNSITVRKEKNDDYVVSTDAPQADRLEHGFVGVDSLGRTYNQPPFPHWQPALDVIEPQMLEAIKQAVPGWWKRASQS